MKGQFSDEVLRATLGAVRTQRRQRAQRAALVVGATAAAVLGLILLPEHDAEETARVPAAPTSPAEVAPRRPTIVVFKTEDIEPRVERIDDAKLAEMLAGRRHGVITMADGRRQLWVPES